MEDAGLLKIKKWVININVLVMDNKYFLLSLITIFFISFVCSFFLNIICGYFLVYFGVKGGRYGFRETIKGFK